MNVWCVLTHAPRPRRPDFEMSNRIVSKFPITRSVAVWVALLLSPCVWADGGDWSHPFGGISAQAYVPLPPIDRSIQDVFDLDTVPLETDLIDLLCADVNGDGYRELAGLSSNRTAIYIVDFLHENSRAVVQSSDAEETLHLSALVDVDSDGAKDILFSSRNGSNQTRHKVYSVIKKKLLTEIEGESRADSEWMFTALDVDFDGSREVLTFGGGGTNGSSFLATYDVESGVNETRKSFEGEVDVSNVAVMQDVGFGETSVYVATNGKGSRLTCFLIRGDGSIPEAVWSVDLRPNLAPVRIAVGRSETGESTLVLGTRRRQDTQTDPPASIIELSAYDGTLLNEMAIDPQGSSGYADCVDLSVADLDDDPEMEIVFRDSLENLHRLDFSVRRNRFMTVLLSAYYLGAISLYTDPWPDNPAVQIVGNRVRFFLLNDDIDPVRASNYVFTVTGKLVGRPILGDTDGNGIGEVLFVSNDGTPKAHRLSYFDPNPPVLPTPTPISSGVSSWALR